MFSSVQNCEQSERCDDECYEEGWRFILELSFFFRKKFKNEMSRCSVLLSLIIRLIY